MRATSQDREAAKLMGINETHVYCLAFGIGAAVAGMSGTLLSSIFFITPSAGEIFVMRSFIIVVLGGMGSVPGAMIGGVIVGLIESIGSLFMNPYMLKLWYLFCSSLLCWYVRAGFLGGTDIMKVFAEFKPKWFVVFSWL